MTAPWRDLLAANERYVSGFAAADLPRTPVRRLVVLTCMDARVDPLPALGLELGDAHVLRNAGAVATDDVIRSLTVSTRLLGTRKLAIVGHTDCGMVGVTNEEIRQQVGSAADGVEFNPLAGVEESVRESVRRIRESPLPEEGLDVAGFLLDVANGRLRPV